MRGHADRWTWCSRYNRTVLQSFAELYFCNGNPKTNDIAVVMDLLRHVVLGGGRCGHIPQVMAALRNTGIGLMRWAGYTNIAAACRRFAAQPTLALKLIGIALEN